MGDPAPPAWMAAAARKWLEDAGAIAEDGAGAGDGRRAFNALPLFGVRVSLAERGRAVCSLRVPAHLTDADGSWHAGAIAAAVDDVCAAAIMSVEGIIKVSVHYDISYFAPAKHHEEVEMDGRVVDRKGRMTAVTTEVRKKESGELVAIGRQWMTTSRPKGYQGSKHCSNMLGLIFQGEKLDSDHKWLNPMIAATERRFLSEGLPNGVVRKRPRPNQIKHTQHTHMDDAAAEAEALRLRLAAVARKWLEDPRADSAGNITHAASQKGHALNSLVLAGARISLSEHGRVVCSFQVPPPLTDSDGTWHAGALAAAVDNMCSAVVFTVVGAPTATVHYGLSYFSPVACNDEVQLDGRVVGRKGKLTAAVVRVRKMGSGELVAIGRQWMTPAWPTKSNKSRSNL
ncbi:uncharacterized protein [Triticum aestivum]|nr:uncharacterized protein LOC123076195 [Triticum aestivum]